MRLLGRDMTTGTTLSAAGHVVLVVWLLSGWGLNHEPLPFEVTEVRLVSGEEFARLVAATTPQPQTEMGQAPEAPGAEAAPEAPETPVPERTPPAPEPQPEPPEAEQPPPPAPDEPPPPAEVTEEITEPVTPDHRAPPPAPDLPPDVRPVPRAADRVAPEAIAPPPPDVNLAPEVTEEATPEAEAPEIVEQEAEAAAPEEATTEIVTEAEEPSGAVETSLRPPSRPSRPAPPAAAETPATEATAVAEAPAAETPAQTAEDEIAAALAAVVSEAPAAEPAGAPAANPGPPMTGSERDAFRLAVSGCWNVDVGSEAARITLVVHFELDRDGRVVGDRVELVSADGGSAAAIDSAYAAARRAILRCETRDGYQLPADKYESWREVRMTFDPSGMQVN